MLFELKDNTKWTFIISNNFKMLITIDLKVKVVCIKR